MRKLSNGIVFLLALMGLVLARTPGLAANTPPDILAQINGNLYEFGQNGVVVGTVPIPAGTDGQSTGDSPPRDISMDDAGHVYVYNGTFAPFLSRYDTVSGTWSHMTFAGWSTVNNVTYGGIVASGNYV